MTLNTHTYMYGSIPATAAAWTRHLAETLAGVEAARTAQLATINPDPDDLVARAYRDAVIRILAEVRTARRMLEEGRYGLCVGCHRRIDDERLEHRRWATQCPDCARRVYQ
ncbi:unannotated protein [freshwater metagenome]|uniref:Unannotated protein n=1 Tax=freshwater metagenome TaxID=449393 RepID=A0A6J7JK05_9ZZZZ|nr:hypothetical protein [Actinomycetota bacterium]